MKAKEPGRRRFLKEGAALAGLAAGAIQPLNGQTFTPDAPAAFPKDAQSYGVRSRFVTTARTGSGTGEHNPFGRVPTLLTPLQESMGIITPSSLHHSWAHGYPPPDIDPRQHRFLIHGMVDHPVIFTMEELKRSPSTSRIHFIECNANTSPDHHGPNAETFQEMYGRTSCSEWTGVLLSLLLKEAGLQKGAKWLIAEGAEPSKYEMSIPVEKALDDIIVAYGQNGEPLRPEQGFPLRLIVPGWEGPRNVKWLRRIKVVDEPYMTKLETSGTPSLRPDGKSRWFQFEMGLKSVITFPSVGQRLTSQGFYEVTGLAWSGGGAIRRVEVSTDGGRSWKDAQLQEPVLRIAHTRFRFPWNWNGEDAVIQSRCTDERGDVQPSLQEFSKIWGVKPDYFLTASNVNHFNPIQPWRITTDGSVKNAMWEL